MRRTRLKIAAKLASELIVKERFARIALRVAKAIIALRTIEEDRRRQAIIGRVRDYINPIWENYAIGYRSGELPGGRVTLGSGGDNSICSVDVFIYPKEENKQQNLNDILRILNGFPAAFNIAVIGEAAIEGTNHPRIHWKIQYNKNEMIMPLEAISKGIKAGQRLVG